jgi:ubiquinone/menaquinone biosynthesis C-methylase UbiE
MSQGRDEHQRLIVEQFSRQAVPFAEMPIHFNEEADRLVLETVEIDPEDTVLDIACGPGLISCVIAQAARHVTGIDITPAMIEQAKAKQQSKGLTNVAWQVGDVSPLPFAPASFSVVFTRYSFHHFLDPKAVLAEMVRVCKPGGRVAVVDVFTTTREQATAYDQVEKLRDPSHTRALLLDELTGLFRDAGLSDSKTEFYKLEVELEKILASSFPNSGDADQVRRIFSEDLGVNRLGVGARRKDGAVWFTFPIVILVGKKWAPLSQPDLSADSPFGIVA